MKKLIIGFILGAVLFGSFGVYAGSEGKLLEVYYNVSDMKINHKSMMPSEKPFIYNGTTYVPIRYVSETLGEWYISDYHPSVKLEEK